MKRKKDIKYKISLSLFVCSTNLSNPFIYIDNYYKKERKRVNEGKLAKKRNASSF